jgi:predicted DNA binding CopG/RHH family protein
MPILEETFDFEILARHVTKSFRPPKPSTTSISIRLPDSLLAHIKQAANKRDIPYQSLIKVWLSEKVASVFETRVPDPKHNRVA